MAAEEQIKALEDRVLLVEQNLDRVGADFYKGNFSASIAFGKAIEALSKVSLFPATPAQITGNQNDYNIQGYTVLRLSTDAARTITGFDGGERGRLLVLQNVGSYTITLSHQSSSSSAANRLISHTGADYALAANAAAIMFYDLDSSRWRIVSVAAASVDLGIFGDGSDGDVTISVNTTLDKDKYYDDLTINNGVTLTTAGFRVFVKGTLTNNGTISFVGNDGGAGGNGANGSGGGGGTYGAGGAAAAALSSGSLYGALAGKAGGAGGSGGVPNGNAGTAGTAGSAQTIAVPSGNGSAGGNGGAGGSPNGASGAAGQAGGATTQATQRRPYTPTYAAMMVEDGSGGLLRTGASGGSGGGGGGGGNSGSGDGPGGGGGGGGSATAGGVMTIFAKTLTNTGTITVKGGTGGRGGNGGNSEATYNDGGGGGGGGGGAGGGGGVMVLVYSAKTNSGTITAAGGTGGAKGNKGTSSAAQQAQDGVAGTDGPAGVLIELTV